MNEVTEEEVQSPSPHYSFLVASRTDSALAGHIYSCMDVRISCLFDNFRNT